MTSPTLLWLRRDLRLTDHPALLAAVERGAPVIPVFIRDHAVDGLGAAASLRLEMALKAMAETLADKGLRLILRAGPAQQVLEALAEETGAGAIYWQRLYEPEAIERDRRIKSDLSERFDVRSFAGQLLIEPWEVQTGQGGYYKVYSPFWRALEAHGVAAPLAAPAEIPAPDQWPESAALEDWDLSREMRRGGPILRDHLDAGEAAAQSRLAVFARDLMADYGAQRDFPATAATSDLSHFLTWGEISPRSCWQAGLRGKEAGKDGAQTFLKEVAWRDFAYHLMYHAPTMIDANWRSDWDGFPWQTDDTTAEVRAWQRGRTGIEIIDAGMRELWVTGRMHNRVRMVAASYLTKHLLVHWRIGQAWFADTLADWDPASNAMGWQWVAGSGPDAAPYFRIFNPETQAKKFDPDGTYRDHWLKGDGARAFHAAIPHSWGLTPQSPAPTPLISLSEGRNRALEAYQQLRDQK